MYQLGRPITESGGCLLKDLECWSVIDVAAVVVVPGEVRFCGRFEHLLAAVLQVCGVGSGPSGRPSTGTGPRTALFLFRRLAAAIWRHGSTSLGGFAEVQEMPLKAFAWRSRRHNGVTLLRWNPAFCGF